MDEEPPPEHAVPWQHENDLPGWSDRKWVAKSKGMSLPIPSMYGIFTYMNG